MKEFAQIQLCLEGSSVFPASDVSDITPGSTCIPCLSLAVPRSRVLLSASLLMPVCSQGSAASSYAEVSGSLGGSWKVSLMPWPGAGAFVKIWGGEGGQACLPGASGLSALPARLGEQGKASGVQASMDKKMPFQKLL